MAKRSEVAVLVKVVPTGVAVDPLTGAVSFDHSRLDVSAADRAAVAVALSLAERHRDEVVIYCVGPRAVTPWLRELVASGAARAQRLSRPDEDDSRPLSDRDVVGELELRGVRPLSERGASRGAGVELPRPPPEDGGGLGGRDRFI